MNKKDLELFKQAIDEGISNKFDKLAAACTEEIVCSERHNLAMQAIVYGKIDTKRTWSPRMKRIVAILVAAALLLTSCGIIFRNEIREVFEELFVELSYEGNKSGSKTIENVYRLEYVPLGYVLVNEKVEPLKVNYKYSNEKGDEIQFEQRILDETYFIFDSESGYSEFYTVNDLNIYYRFTNKMHCYIWSDDNYTLYLKSSKAISKEEIVLIIVKMSTK